ncbi:MAG TPA: DNA-processing protein DprA [Waddliaceae bacterium]
MDNFDQTTALAILAATPLLGSVKIRLLLEHFGSPGCVLQAKPQEVKHAPGITSKIMENWGWWQQDRSWHKNLELANKQGVSLIPFTHEKYPKCLTRLSDFPILLYVKGELRDCDQRSLAIVGTRIATTYGKEMASKIACDLASLGFTIVSGLARGIDTAAHCGALQSGRTIAVIGSGLANIYPRENESLAEAIANKGALISEFPMTTPPGRQNFPQRNRVVSSLSLGIVLIEAPENSGALITMNKGWSQGLKLFALPGRADSENFKLNHRLIKEGRATLVENAEDVSNSFSKLFNMSIINKDTPKLPSLEDEELGLFKQLPNEELSIEEIVLLTKLPISKLNILLMGLVLKKAMKELPGKMYKKSIT